MAKAQLLTKFLYGCLAVIVLSFSIPLFVFAQQEDDPGQALEISPPILPLEVNPGETISSQILLRNVSPSDQIATGEVNDFVASGEDGTPRLLLDEERDEDNPYSMTGWVSGLEPTLLVSGEVKQIPITITVPADASPGGHYGVIRFSATPPELEETGVALSASVGTLVLANVSGEINEELSVEEFSVSRNDKVGTFFETTPLDFIQRIRNTGNTHTQPNGQVTIRDMFGGTVATLNVNLPPRYILPQSTRRFEQPLDESVIGDKWLFGRYSAELELTYGEDEQVLTESTTFWVIPYKLIAAVIIGLILVFFALRTALKRYKQNIIDQARGN